jgi:hypothetical protein
MLSSSSSESVVTTPIQPLPSKSELRSILQYVNNLPTTSTATTDPATLFSDYSIRHTENKTIFDLAVSSLEDLRNHIVVQLVHTLQMEVEYALATATHYVETLATAEFDYITLKDSITHFNPSEPNIDGEPVQSVYSHLLDRLRILSFEKYPKALSETNLDVHLTNIARISLDYFLNEKQRVSSLKPFVEGEKETGCISSMSAPSFPPSETMPVVRGSTSDQLSQRRYILVSVSVDTVPVERQLVVWHISVHIPSLPDNEDPDYECLMLPQVLREKHPKVMVDLGFAFDKKRKMFYHQGTEFGRRRADSEEVSLEKFTNYLAEIRSGLHGAGFNNGLVLLFETGEDLALVQQLLSVHHHNIFLDVVKGITCLDHYLRMMQPAQSITYSWPSYQYRIGQMGCWTSNVSSTGNAVCRIKAETKPECIYNICKSVLGTPPVFNEFMMWYSYLVNHNETNSMVSTLQHILELLPLQTHIDQQLFTNRVPIVLEGIYAARSEVEAAWPHKACARQTIRRLVFLGFTLNVLKKSFETNPKYEIPSIVFLQNMSEAQRLQVHSQTNHICRIIKQYFLRSATNDLGLMNKA